MLADNTDKFEDAIKYSKEYLSLIPKDDTRSIVLIYLNLTIYCVDVRNMHGARQNIRVALKYLDSIQDVNLRAEIYSLNLMIATSLRYDSIENNFENFLFEVERLIPIIPNNWTKAACYFNIGMYYLVSTSNFEKSYEYGILAFQSVKEAKQRNHIKDPKYANASWGSYNLILNSLMGISKINDRRHFQKMENWIELWKAQLEEQFSLDGYIEFYLFSSDYYLRSFNYKKAEYFSQKAEKLASFLPHGMQYARAIVLRAKNCIMIDEDAKALNYSRKAVYLLNHEKDIELFLLAKIYLAWSYFLADDNIDLKYKRTIVELDNVREIIRAKNIQSKNVKMVYANVSSIVKGSIIGLKIRRGILAPFSYTKKIWIEGKIKLKSLIRNK